MRVRLVHVVVPAHDEAALLPSCLAALAAAAARLAEVRPDVAVGTTVVLDSCADDSTAVCRAWPVEALEVAVANVGAARAAGTAAARDRAAAAGVDARHAWVAWTDADSLVAPDWLVDQVAVAEAGADVVLGRVEPDATAPTSVVTRWHDRHPPGRVGVHGAHLGVRLSAYDEVGGVRALPLHEDVDLVTRLRSAGARPGVAGTVVVTSSRLQGRTPGGFAGYLADLADLGA